MERTYLVRAEKEKEWKKQAETSYMK